MIENLKLREPLCVKPTIDLMDLLTLFQEGNSHLAMVTPNPLGTLECLRQGTRPTEKEAVIGIVTMEDVLEKLIQRDILDETDVSRSSNPMMLYYTPKAHLPTNTSLSSSSYLRGLSSYHPSRYSKNHRRPRIFAAGSVVSSDYYNANRLEHFGPTERESSVKIMDTDHYETNFSSESQEEVVKDKEMAMSGYQETESNRRNTIA